MKKKQRTSKTRTLPAAELDAMHDAGVDLPAHVDLGMAVRPVNVDFPVALADTFFVRGTLVGAEYGGAPVLQFNEHHHRKTEIEVNERLLRDANLLGEGAGVGFHYGPHLWMPGEVEPLKALHDRRLRQVLWLRGST